MKKVWDTIPKTIVSLGWNTELVDDKAHTVKAKTDSSLLAWASILLIQVAPSDEGKTIVSVAAETAVTTITAMLDYGRTRQRIELFLQELLKLLSQV